jgi:hypothetical protein
MISNIEFVMFIYHISICEMIMIKKAKMSIMMMMMTIEKEINLKRLYLISFELNLESFLVCISFLLRKFSLFILSLREINLF